MKKQKLSPPSRCSICGRLLPAKLERNEEIVRRHTSGETLRAIASDLGISFQRVDQIIKAYRWAGNRG